jgi:hypothetical protein
MIGFLRMLARPEPVLSEAGPRDAAALAALHAAAFRRGWSEDEFERLLLDHNVIVHRAITGRTLAGFILSRLAAAAASDASCSTCICAGSPASAPPRCFSRWTRTTRRPGGSTRAPASATSAAGRPIMRAARSPPPTRSCSAATWPRA